MAFDLEQFACATLVAFALSVALVDVQTHRIPNVLCFSGAIAGILLQILMQGTHGALAALSGAAVGLCMFLPFYVLRAFGAGDVKAMSAAGAFLGPEHAAVAVAATLIAGSVMGAAVLLKVASSPAAAFYRVFSVMGAQATSRRGEQASSVEQRRFPYGAAIAAGVIVALFLAGRF